MSGGRFDYKQHFIQDIITEIEDEIEKQGKIKDDINDFYRIDFYNQYPEEKYYETHPVEVQEIFKTAIKKLKEAAIYAHRIDWYLSGDDSADSLIKRLKEDLHE